MTDKNTAALAAHHPENNLDMVGRWYMVDKDGMATLCADQKDAEFEAKDADAAWPEFNPHRAVRLVEASFEAADMATAAAQGFRDGAASLAASAGGPVACGNCGGTGWMVRDPDIGTDQECFVCEGSGSYSEAAPPTAQAEVAKLKGQRMVLCALLGECLPVIDALMQMPGDDDSDARLNGLAGRITGALDALAEDQVKGGES